METEFNTGRDMPTMAVTEIPPLPEAALYVLSVARKADASADEVARALGSDQSIALRFLSIANSAYFSTTHRISTLQHCVAWLGLDFVRSTLIALGVDRAAAAVRLPQFDRKAFWEHNMAVAACCELIANQVHTLTPGEAYLAGLCHDIGKMVMTLTHGDLYNECLSYARRTGEPIYQAEIDTIGLDHALVGASALREWHMSPDLVYAVLNHHEDELMSPQGQLVAVLSMAQGLCSQVGSEPGPVEAMVALERREQAMRRLRLSPEAVDGVAQELERQMEQVEATVLAMVA